MQLKSVYEIKTNELIFFFFLNDILVVMINVFELLLLKNPHVITLLLKDTRQHTGSKCILAVFRCHQVEESLNEMDFQLFLDLYFTDGDYT